MKAVVANGSGGPEVLEVVNLPPPDPAPDEVLIRVAAAGVNRSDLLQRQGAYAPEWRRSPLGLEVAGTIDRLGPEVDGWAVGDRVGAILTGGGYAELTAVNQALLLRVPDGLDLR